MFGRVQASKPGRLAGLLPGCPCPLPPKGANKPVFRKKTIILLAF
jgi:hypothetical protein